MKSGKLLIIAITVIAAAFAYFIFGNSEQAPRISGDSTSQHASTQAQNKSADISDKHAGAFAGNSESSVTDSDQSPEATSTNLSADSTTQASTSDLIEAEFAKLSPPQGLSSATAEHYMLSRDFDNLFEYARQIDRNSESYEVEAKYQDIFRDSEQLHKNDVYLEDFTCNNRVCFAKVGYHDRDDIELFMNDVFFRKDRGFAGIIARAVSIDGVNQMRIIFDYTDGSLILD